MNTRVVECACYFFFFARARFFGVCGIFSRGERTLQYYIISRSNRTPVYYIILYNIIVYRVRSLARYMFYSLLSRRHSIFCVTGFLSFPYVTWTANTDFEFFLILIFDGFFLYSKSISKTISRLEIQRKHNWCGAENEI